MVCYEMHVDVETWNEEVIEIGRMQWKGAYIHAVFTIQVLVGMRIVRVESVAAV